MNKIEQIESLMYSYDDWNTVARGKTNGYHFEIKGDNQFLFYFGANHSRDISDPQYEKIRAYWESFLTKTKEKNAIVLVEGGVRPVHESEEKAVKRDSEAGFITFLAKKVSIPTHSPEPDSLKERKYIVEKFGEDKANWLYFSRFVNSWQTSREPRPSFKSMMKMYERKKEPMTSWIDYGFPLEKMKKIHEKMA